MQSKPFATFEEAKKAVKHYAEYDVAYARPNPDKQAGGYVVIYANEPWWQKPALGGCPRAR